MAFDLKSFIASLPPDTHKVRVRGPTGGTTYKKVDDLLPSDDPMLSPSGDPVILKTRAIPKPAPNTPAPPAGIPAPGGFQPPVATVVIPTQEKIETDQVEGVRAVRRRRHGTNTVIREVKKSSGGDGVFEALMLALSEEAELIEFERDRLIQNQQPTAQITEQRVKVLKLISDAWLKRRARSNGASVDMESPAFQAVFSFILETFRSAVEDAGARPEFVETIFAKLAKRLTDDWRAEAKIRIKEKTAG